MVPTSWDLGKLRDIGHTVYDELGESLQQLLVAQCSPGLNVIPWALVGNSLSPGGVLGDN